MNKNDTLAAQALQQLLGDENDNGMPVILARRLDPQIRPDMTCDLSDFGFEGLRPVTKNGKQSWEVYHDFVLIIDGKTGNCRIPDTERNRRRLERLSKGGKETVTRVEIDENGQPTKREEVIDIPSTYQRLQDNVAKSTMVDAVAARVVEMMKTMGMNAAAAPLDGGISPDLQAAPVPNLPQPLEGRRARQPGRRTPRQPRTATMAEKLMGDHMAEVSTEADGDPIG